MIRHRQTTHEHSTASAAELFMRRQTPDQLIDDYASYAREQFADARKAGAVPVYIPAKNEERDIAHTLLSIARGTRDGEGGYAVVVDNGSEDDTAKVARRMGAQVISVEHGRKMAATKAAFTDADEIGAPQLLFTDADTLVPKPWAAEMRRRLVTADAGRGSAIFGNSLLAYNRPHVDAVLSGAKLVRGLQTAVTGNVVPRGHNYGAQFDPDGAMLEEIMRLPDAMFAGDDTAIGEALKKSGAALLATTSLKTIVLTRNDRVDSLRTRVSSRYNSDRAKRYDEEYA